MGCFLWERWFLWTSILPQQRAAGSAQGFARAQRPRNRLNVTPPVMKQLTTSCQKLGRTPRSLCNNSSGLVSTACAGLRRVGAASRMGCRQRHWQCWGPGVTCRWLHAAPNSQAVGVAPVPEALAWAVSHQWCHIAEKGVQALLGPCPRCRVRGGPGRGNQSKPPTVCAGGTGPLARKRSPAHVMEGWGHKGQS